MKQLSSIIFLLLFIFPKATMAQLLPRLGAQRAGISAFTFLKIDESPRSAALAGANACLSADGYSMVTNPASMADVSSPTLSTSNVFWATGIQNPMFVAQLPDKKYGVWGVSTRSVLTKNMEKRTVFQPDGTGETFSVGTASIAVAYAKRLSDRFNAGVALRYTNAWMAEFGAQAFSADLSFLYKLNYKNIRFAAVIQNFGNQTKLNGDVSQFQIVSTPINTSDFQIPTVFKLGFSMTAYENEKHKLDGMFQLDQPNDNAANVRLGVEYQYIKQFFLRAGMMAGVYGRPFPVGGVGFKTHLGRFPLRLDYAAEPLAYLGVVQRLGLSLEIVKKEIRVLPEAP